MGGCVGGYQNPDSWVHHTYANCKYLKREGWDERKLNSRVRLELTAKNRKIEECTYHISKIPWARTSWCTPHKVICTQSRGRPVEQSLSASPFVSGKTLSSCTALSQAIKSTQLQKCSCSGRIAGGLTGSSHFSLDLACRGEVHSSNTSVIRLSLICVEYCFPCHNVIQTSLQ